jgi:peptidoglycan/LPS O-acetylase OafA/YrhL
MSLILNEKYVGDNASYRLFVTNRFIRLYPLYWVVWLCTLLVFLFANVPSATKLHSLLSVDFGLCSSVFFVFTNLFIFGQDVVMFLGVRPEDGSLFFTSDFWNTQPHLFQVLLVPQAWSLALELMFYLVAPFVLRKGWRTVLTLILASFCLRLCLYNFWELKDDPWSYRFFPTELLFFLLGYGCYKIYLRIKAFEVPRIVNVVVLLGVVLCTLCYGFVPDPRWSFLPFSFKQVLYFGGLFFSIPILFYYLKNSKWDAQIGELSYPIYISHVLFVILCGSFASGCFRSGWFVAVLSIVFSLAANRFVVAPIEKYRQRRFVGAVKGIS